MGCDSPRYFSRFTTSLCSIDTKKVLVTPRVQRRSIQKKEIYMCHMQEFFTLNKCQNESYRKNARSQIIIIGRKPHILLVKNIVIV